MSEPLSSASERYLQRLADALEALGPTETSEVLAEVWSHISEAVADAAGNEDDVLARFGSPEVLAARILEERGVIQGASAVPEAESWRRLAAVVFDAAMWLVLVWLFAIPLVVIAMHGLRSYSGSVIAWVATAAVVAVAAWWWVKKRRERGYTTVGMRAMGLRRIRVGESTRLVRERDVPGLGAGGGGRVAAMVGAVLALLVLASLTYSVLANQADQRNVEAGHAVQWSGDAVSVITSLYRDVATGAPLASVEGAFSPSTRQAADELLARHSQGLVTSYAMSNMMLLEYAPWEDSSVGENTILVSISVMEYPPDSDQPQVYDYRVGLVVQSSDRDGWSGQWLIQSVDGPHQ